MLILGNRVPYHVVVVDLEEVGFFSVGRNTVD
jgi:23S rRNA G2069 N7-methylase RlmK/C1962 C5-methylase RlmI